MGYRSDVRIVTSEEGFKKLEQFVENYLKERKGDIKEDNLLNFLYIKSQGKGQCYFGWDSIKWYDFCGEIEIDAIVEGLDYLAKNEYSYRYTIIGENLDDIEENSYDGNKEDIYLEYPSIIRQFDDDYTKEYLEEPLKEELDENKEEIGI